MNDGADECSDVSVASRPIHLQDGINSLFPGLDSSGSHPIAKEVSFFNSPTTLEWVAFHVILVKLRHYFVQHSKMLFKVVIGPDTYIIHVD